MNLEIPTQATWHEEWRATGFLRWAVPSATPKAEPILQQEWALRWGNNTGTKVTVKWITIPVMMVENGEL